MFAKFPNNISIKTIAHYAQTMTSCTFKKYDYGLLGNPFAYMRITAPDYKLNKITAPTYFYYADIDNLAPPNVRKLLCILIDLLVWLKTPLVIF